MQVPYRKVGAILLVLVAVSSLVFVPVAAADSHQTDGDTDPQNASATKAPHDYTLQELDADGYRLEDAPPGVRPAGPYNEFGVKYLPTHLWVIQTEDSPWWSWLGSRTTNERGKIQFLTNRPREMGDVKVDDLEITLRIGYYQRGTEKYEEGNVTKTRPAATNISTQTEQIEVSDGRDSVMVDVQPHFDEPREATMCAQMESLDEYDCLQNPDHDLRWQWTQHASEYAKMMPQQSLGAQALRGFLLVAILAVVTAIAAYAVRKLIDIAEDGPRISWITAMVIGIGHIILLLIFSDQIFELLVTRKYLVPGYMGLWLGLLIAQWFGAPTYLAAALRVRMKDVRDSSTSVDDEFLEANQEHPDAGATPAAADGGQTVEKAAQPGADESGVSKGIISLDIVPIRLSRRSGERTVAGSGGFLSWIAKLRGGPTKLQFNGNPQTKVDVDAGPFDEAFFMDPESDDPYRHDPISLEPSLPPIKKPVPIETENGTEVRHEWNIGPYGIGLGALLTSYLAGGFILGTNIGGLLIGIVLVTLFGVLEPDEGDAQIDLAPMHYGSAVAAMITHAKKLGNAKTWQEMYYEKSEEEAKNRAQESTLQAGSEMSQAQAVYNEFTGSETPDDAPDSEANDRRTPREADDD